MYGKNVFVYHDTQYTKKHSLTRNEITKNMGILLLIYQPIE